MPAAIAPALIAIAASAGASSVAATAIGTIAASVIVGAISIGAQFALSRLLGKKAQKGDPQLTQLTIRQPIPVRQRAYGRCKIGGALFYEDATPIVGASLTLGVVHCEGPIDGIESFWLNDSLSRGAGLGGQNLSLPWAFYIYLEARLGEDSQGVNTLLPAGWTGQLKGLCYTVMQCRQPNQPEKNFQYYYPNGVPSVRILARCSKIYDPREEAQDWDDRSTWTWSRNPALIVLDYLTFARTDVDGISIPRGMGLPKSRMNLASFSAFADVCDESVRTIYAYDGNGNPVLSEGTEPRYSCDGVYNMEEAPTEVLGRILATCDGHLYTLADGTVGIRGGKWTEPTVTIDDSMISTVDLSQGNDKFTTFNQLKISITAVNMDHQVVEAESYDDFDSQDEIGVLSQDFGLPFVQSYSQARRLAKIQMAKGNPRWRFNSLVCSLAALDALGEEFIRVTYSTVGIDEDFMVLGFKIISATTCELQLASISSEAYSWNPDLEDLAPPSTSGVLPVVVDDRSTLVHIMADGSNLDFGLASDAVVNSEDWGTASASAHGDADLGLMSA